jgi:uncharacterized cupin superfamily protein
MTDTKPVLNIDAVTLRESTHGKRFAAKLGMMGGEIGAKQLGCLLHVVEPGKIAFPFHVHHANEEMFVILEGTGEYRYGSDTYPIRAGDVLAAPAGGPEVAHQIINTGTTAMKYLGISTKLQPEVVEYPDSKKFGVSSRSTDGTPFTARLRFIGRTDTTLDYWDGADADKQTHWNRELSECLKSRTCTSRWTASLS